MSSRWLRITLTEHFSGQNRSKTLTFFIRRQVGRNSVLDETRTAERWVESCRAQAQLSRFTSGSISISSRPGILTSLILSWAEWREINKAWPPSYWRRSYGFFRDEFLQDTRHCQYLLAIGGDKTVSFLAISFKHCKTSSSQRVLHLMKLKL